MYRHTDLRGHAPLTRAAVLGNVQALTCLLQYGAPYADVWDVAEEHQQRSILTILKRHHAYLEV